MNYFVLHQYSLFIRTLIRLPKNRKNALLAHLRSGVAREGASGGTRPGAQLLGAHQHTFCCNLETRLKQKFRPMHA